MTDKKDKKTNNEYEPSDLDELNPEYDGSVSDTETVIDEEDPTGMVSSGSSHMKRNIIIAVAVIIVLMLAYKFFASSSKKEDATIAKTNAPSMTMQPIAANQTPVVQPEESLVPPPPEGILSAGQLEIKKKLSVLEISQQSLRSDMSNVNEQMSNVNSNVNDLTTQLQKLNESMQQLSSQLYKQSEEIGRLEVRLRSKKAPKKHHQAKPVPRYYIKAAISGRAWLIAPNGSTITVKEGTIITGYGVVQLIDPIQGRVVTSSGQVIRFSQDDS